jgi:hypothetical protein
MYNIAVLSLKGVVVHVVHHPVMWFMCRAAHFLSLGAKVTVTVATCYAELRALPDHADLVSSTVLCSTEQNS